MLGADEREDLKYRTANPAATNKTMAPIIPPTTPPTSAEELLPLCEDSSESGIKQFSPHDVEDDTSLPVENSDVD